MKKVLTILLASSLTLGLAACGSSSNGAKDTPAPSTAPATEKPSEKPADKPVTVTFQNIYPDPTAPNNKIMKKIVADFEASHKNIKIELDSLNTDQQKIKLKTQAASGEVPDITIVNPAAQMKPFVDGGILEPLDDMLGNGLKETFQSGILDYYSFNDKVYALPDGNNLGVVFYNKELFAQAGVEVPKTFEDLVEVAKKLKAKGITPIAVGEKDTWTGSFLFMNIVLRTNNGPNFLKDVLEKKKTFNDPAFVEAVQKLEDLVQVKGFQDGATAVDQNAAGNLFKSGKAAMHYIGTWETGGMDASAIKDKVGVFKFPTVGGKGDPDQFMLAPGSAFAVSAKSKHMKETKEFLAYFMTNYPKVSFEMKNAVGIAQKVDGDFTAAGYSPLAMEVLGLFKGVKGGDLAFDNTMNPATAQTHLTSIQRVFVEQIKPENVAKEHQASFDANNK
ncbi:extracellular solute-binding protein [Paenibacillus sp. N1-5-1-14]|uniref:extracellular solute-binding protein n=1 Tax=Paenibacillus radicibacter TaxID=2972488 RepID=UPI0021597FC5|nr:extracellular solute-binding protein [Paenibacillus radicibacter]MCR8645176.1 extracellular solute-binding protein [Paenibacillus radicibacter]